MTKYFLILCCVLEGLAACAQDDVDAMRYSQTSFYGDTRFMTMGGSFGALGANLSCMNFNPAGIAVYRNGEFVLTPGVRIQNATATHYGNNATDFSTKLNISNIGFVSAWDQTNPYPPSSKSYSNWNQRNAFGISYNRLADFNFNTSMQGSTDTSSIINDFVNVAQGYYPSQLVGNYEWLAYQTYLINPNSDDPSTPADSNHYWGMMLPHTPVLQNKSIKSAGRMGELAFSFAHSFDDKYYLGATLGIPLVKYTRQSTYTETDYKKSISPWDGLKYEENLQTSGSGYNLKVGGIYRINEQLRVAAYAHTPSVITLTDNYTYTMTASYDKSIYQGAPLTFQQSYTGNFKYKLYTPGRVGGSVAYIHNRTMALNLDLEYVAYGGVRYKDTYDQLRGANLTIQKKYTGALNTRLGAEFNLEPIILRAGYAQYGSPFGPLYGKFSRSNYSAGIGFKRKSNTYYDLGFVYTVWNEDYYLYQGVAPTNIHNSILYVTFTLGVKFN